MITFINQFRKVTVSSIFVKSKWSNSIKPKLTLSGNWLASAGFEIGEKVIIEVQDKMLVIRKADDDVFC
jgi:toxic protein SymE